jgi:hypothetical protein
VETTFTTNMTKQEKLLDSIRNNPKAVRFADACKITEGLRFSRQGGKGSASNLRQGRRSAVIELSKSRRLYLAVSGETITRNGG